MGFEFRLPDIGEGIAEGEIVQWLVKQGDTVQEDQPLVEVMTDKVTAEIPSPVSGTITQLKYKAGDVVAVGEVIVVFGESSATPPKPATEEASAPIVKESIPACSVAAHGGSASPIANGLKVSGGNQKAIAAPATRKLAREIGVPLNAIAGTGPKGRITPDDVRRAKQGQGQVQDPAPMSSGILQPGITFADVCNAQDERKPFAGMRRKIGEHLVKSKQTAPHFSYVEEVDMTELVKVRSQLKEDAKAQGAKLTYLPFIMKAVIAGLREFPSLNSMLEEHTQEIVYKRHYNLGVAVATDDGLIVPVVKNAEAKGIIQLAKEIEDLSTRAREGKLALDDFRGGTFTLTSIGSIGGLFSVPIINYPEVAILGINKITPRPMVQEGEIVIRDMMYLSISCDHRVVDGAEAALFINKVIENLQTPTKLLL